MHIQRTTQYNMHDATDAQFNIARARLCRMHGDPVGPTTPGDSSALYEGTENPPHITRWTITRWEVPPVDDENVSIVILCRFL